MIYKEVIELLEQYNKLLEEEGYCDDDLWCEPPTAIDQFLKTRWAKENIHLNLNITTVKDFEVFESLGECIKEGSVKLKPR